MTHWGVVEGYDARTPSNYKFKTRLRETKLFWVSEFGIKYSKKHYGVVSGEKWPMYALKLESIKLLSQPAHDQP